MGAAAAKLAKRAAAGLARLLASSGGEEEGKGRQKALILLGVAMCILSLPALLIGFMGIIRNEFAESQDVSRKLPSTITYAKIQEDYIRFNALLDEELLGRIERLKGQYAITRADEEGNTQTVQPAVMKNVSMEKPEIKTVLAFIHTKNMEAWREGQEWKYSSQAVLATMLLSIRITDRWEYDAGTHTLHYYASCNRLGMEEVLENLYGRLADKDKAAEQKAIFEASYASYYDLEDEEADASQGDMDLGLLTTYPTGLAIPQIYQYDPKWANIPYGDGVIGDSGCAPTSFAMVASYMAGRFVSPVDTCRFAESHGMYVNGSGTAWSFFPAAAKEYGFQCRQLASPGEAVAALQRGEPVISSMRPGTFTSTGHLIVIRGITEKGHILVVDPADSSSKQFCNREFEPNGFFSQVKAYWAFYR